MKIKLKKGKIEVGADDEGLAKHVVDNYEKNWKEKYDTRHNAKKEILELKHKHKMEEEHPELYNKEENEEKKEAEKENNAKRVFLIISFILFLVYGLFCITGFRDQHTVAAVISLIQIVLVVLSILTSLNIFSTFKNDYKVYMIISLLLIIPWIAFAV